MLYLQYKYQSFIQKHYENRTPAFAQHQQQFSGLRTCHASYGNRTHRPIFIYMVLMTHIRRRGCYVELDEAFIDALHLYTGRKHDALRKNIHQLVDAGFFDKEMYLNHNILTTRNLQMGYRRRKNAMPIPEQYRIVTATERRREERAERRREKAIRKEEAATEKNQDKESSTDTPTILAQNLLKFKSKTKTHYLSHELQQFHHQVAGGNSESC